MKNHYKRINGPIIEDYKMAEGLSDQLYEFKWSSEAASNADQKRSDLEDAMEKRIEKLSSSGQKLIMKMHEFKEKAEKEEDEKLKKVYLAHAKVEEAKKEMQIKIITGIKIFGKQYLKAFEELIDAKNLHKEAIEEEK